MNAKLLPKTMFAFLIFSCCQSVMAGVYKCENADGSVGFSDRPCRQAETVEKIEVYVGAPVTTPPTPIVSPALKREAEADRKAREAKLEKRKKIDAEIDTSAAEIRKIKEENYDAEKCRSAQLRMTAMQKREPLMYKSSPDFYELRRFARLYCGN